MLDEHLVKITEIIVEYESGEWKTIDNLRALLRSLTSQMYYLTQYKIRYKNQHNTIRYKHKGSIGAGEVLAHEQCSELYQIRYILQAAKNVKDSITMEMSIIKAES